MLPRATTSWIAPQSSGTTLLYVSNTDEEVTVYNFSTGTLVGVLTGFQKPTGLCADRLGNVYVADASAKTIVEYAHGGAKPMKTLDDSPDHPYACSVSSATGDLAVADDNGGTAEGDIAIWPHATGKPARYTDSTIYNVTGCVYDPRGNLFASGIAAGANTASFAWMAHGSAKLTNLFVPGPDTNFKWNSIGVGWDGQYFTIDNYDISRILVTHGQAYYAGEVSPEFNGWRQNGPFTFYYQAGMATMAIAGVNNDSSYDSGAVLFWNYPAAGNPTSEITHGVDSPYGVAISLGK